MDALITDLVSGSIPYKVPIFERKERFPYSHEILKGLEFQRNHKIAIKQGSDTT